MQHDKNSSQPFAKLPVLRRTVEVCYTNNDGSVAVHYRRDEGSDDANDMINQVEKMKEKQGDNCRYFIRMA